MRMRNSRASSTKFEFKDNLYFRDPVGKLRREKKTTVMEIDVRKDKSQGAGIEGLQAG